LQGRAVYELPEAGVLGLRLEGRGALSGRRGTPHHSGGGLGAWWGRGVSPFSPWLEVRGVYYRFAEQTGYADPDAFVLEGGLGAATHWRRFRGTLRLGALRVVNDDGFDETAADLGGDVVLGPVVLSARGGTALRDDALRPRASLGARWALGRGVALRLDTRWRALVGEAPEAWSRWVAGLTVEWTR